MDSGPDSSAPEIRTPAVIVGTGPAGLATSACLQRAGVEHVLLDGAAEVGASWRRHYDRLHDAGCGPTGLRPGEPMTMTARPGLYLCGFRISTRGMLNQIRHDAQEIARGIATGA